MAAVNGTLTPPPQQAAPPSPTSAKRKRSTAGENAANVEVPTPNHNGASPPSGTARDDSIRRLQPTLEHILSVLQDYDPKPSVLERAVGSATSRAPSGESETKRAKLNTPTGAPSIASLVRSSAHSSLEAFEKDVESATSAALAPLETDDLSAPPLSAEQMKLQADILGLRKMARVLVAREGARIAHADAKRASTQPPADGAAVNGEVTVKEEPGEEEELESRTVLTLYGTAQGPKQLFSSLQQPVTIRPKQEGAASTVVGSVKVTMPLRESQLPNIISTTEVYPLPQDVDRKRKPRTFGEVFPPPAHHQPLAPPKFPKTQTAKGNTITWVPQEPLDVPARNKSSHIYSNQKLAAGQWLGYGGVDMPKDVTSPTAKQKSRQRALSTGEAQLPPSEATLAAVQSAKEDALFRSVFSSFAPSRDDSQAIVPTEVKNMVWWHKVGLKRFEETFPAEDPPIDPALLAVQEPAEAGIATEKDNEPLDEIEAFRELAENYVPDESDPFEAMEKTQAEKDTDEVLQEISELIGTLASHQRIRNSSLATNPLTPALQNSSLASLAGSPSTPSNEEVDVYHLLKSQLTLLISQLPPYAVAKLDGDQLNDLNISRTLIIETEDHRGVLEEDQYSRRASMPAAVAPPSLSRMASSGSTQQQYAASGPQYGRGTPAAYSTSSRQTQPIPAYHAQHGLHRTPSVSYAPRPAASTYQTPAPAYNSATQRPAYNPSQYAQQTPRPSYAQQPATGQHYSQRPAAPATTYGGAQNQQYHQSTPQAGMRSGAWPSQQTQNGYYQRPQTNGQNAVYNTTPAARTGSPMKPAPSAAQPAAAMRGGYGTPVPNAHQRSSYYAPQYAGSPQPSTPAPAAPMGYNSVGANPQQMMLDRQQAQAQTQNQARLAAQSSFHRHGSGSATPQPQPQTPQPQPQPLSLSQYGGGGQQQQPPPNGAGASPMAV